MTAVRVFVGADEGAVVLASDGRREHRKVEGPHLPGWGTDHLEGSPVDPERIRASRSTGWLGPPIQRRDDGGRTWNPPLPEAIARVAEPFVVSGVLAGG